MQDDKNETLSEMDEQTLLRTCKENNDPKYIGELIRRYTPVIKAQAARFKNDTVSTDDLISEGYLAAFKAVKSFDSSKSENFRSFLSVCIANRIISILRISKRNPVADIQSPDDTPDNITPETICLDNELENEIRGILTPLEYNVFELYIEGNSYGEIKEKLGITEKSVDNAMQRVRKKLTALYDKR